MRCTYRQANETAVATTWAEFTYDAARPQFTGKERDSESGNDYFGARYFGSSMGRFMSPDELFIDQDPSNPQSWNLYSYVRNNPLVNVDDDGRDCIYVNNDTGKYEGFNRGDCDNSDPNKANTGRYVDGTVDTIYTSTGDKNGVVGGYSGVSDSGNLMSGTFASPLPSTGGFDPGSLGAAVFGAQNASTWNNAAGAVNAAGGLEASLMAPWAVAGADCLSGESKSGCAVNMALAVVPGGSELRGGAKALKAAEEMKAADYIAKYLKGGINAVFPGQFKGASIKEIEAAAKSGDRAARTALKLLTDGRFKK
ncbi:MAG: RHS repeat-associated core domain-containing protein [Terracidiphilus sp.]|nr:RHS repeat-associated core domain-containing protein [Terracidiphilus sp.]